MFVKIDSMNWYIKMELDNVKLVQLNVEHVQSVQMIVLLVIVHLIELKVMIVLVEEPVSVNQVSEH